MLDCVNLDGSRRLKADTSIECDGERYNTLRIAGIITLLLYGLGIPVIFATCLVGHRDGIRIDQALRLRGLAESRGTTPFWDVQKRLQRLYTRFKPSVYYWSLVAIAKKATVLGIVFMLGEEPAVAAAAITLALVLFSSLHVQVQPYRDGMATVSAHHRVTIEDESGTIQELREEALSYQGHAEPRRSGSVAWKPQGKTETMLRKESMLVSMANPLRQAQSKGEAAAAGRPKDGRPRAAAAQGATHPGVQPRGLKGGATTRKTHIAKGNTESWRCLAPMAHGNTR